VFGGRRFHEADRCGNTRTGSLGVKELLEKRLHVLPSPRSPNYKPLVKIMGLRLRCGNGDRLDMGSLDGNGVVLILKDAFDVSGSIGGRLIRP
jgi:hypothetical protein